jgi:hypothetical protein
VSSGAGRGAGQLGRGRISGEITASADAKNARRASVNAKQGLQQRPRVKQRV